MFERFTEDARNIIVLAQREASELSHGYIGTEHLLLGLVLDRGAAGDILRELEITYEAVREKVIEIIGRGNTAPVGHSPFTPRAREVLRQADDISRHAGHGYIGPEHLVLALLQNEDAVACLALKALNVSAPVLSRMIAASFARSYTAGMVFHGFTAAAKGGRCDVNPLRTDAEAATEDVTGDEEVREIRIALGRSEYFVCLDAATIPDTGRYLDYHRARSVAAATGARIHIAVPTVKTITAQTAAGIDVVIGETVEWEHVPLSTRIEVLA